MTAKDLLDLYDYGYWANEKLFGVLSRLTPEEFTQPVAGSYGSPEHVGSYDECRVGLARPLRRCQAGRASRRGRLPDGRIRDRSMEDRRR